MKKMLFILFMLIGISEVFAQSEKDVHEKDVPSGIKEFLKKNYPEAGKLHYYKEIENDTSFYEASFKYKGDKYDIRFLMDGTLYEVEKTIKLEQLPGNVQDKIREDLSKRYSRYVVKKAEEVNLQSGLIYEVNVKAKKGKHSGYFELFYSKAGVFIREKEETLNSIPNNSGF